MAQWITGVKVSLFFFIGFNLASTIVLAVVSSWFAITHGMLTAIMVGYAKCVWRRIPLAAANQRAAITCVQGNLGMVFLGLSNILLFTLWFFLWGYVFQSVLFSPWMKTQEYAVEVMDDLYGKQHEEAKVLAWRAMAIWGCCLLSFYWTFQVLRNVVHTTLAGTVGAWWFTPFCIGLINALLAVIFTLVTDSIVIGTSVLFALLISQLVFVVLMSAVDSIIVLFAEAPGGRRIQLGRALYSPC
jgi:hypothetical protein